MFPLSINSIECLLILRLHEHLFGPQNIAFSKKKKVKNSCKSSKKKVNKK